MSVIENSSTAKSATCKLQPDSKAASEWNKSLIRMIYSPESGKLLFCKQFIPNYFAPCLHGEG